MNVYVYKFTVVCISISHLCFLMLYLEKPRLKIHCFEHIFRSLVTCFMLEFLRISTSLFVQVFNGYLQENQYCCTGMIHTVHTVDQQDIKKKVKSREYKTKLQLAITISK